MMKSRLLEIFAVLSFLAMVIVPSLPAPCQAKMISQAPSHACCHSQNLCSAKISKPPCCESCRNGAFRPMMTATSASHLEIQPFLALSLERPIFSSYKKSVESPLPLSAASPPIYLQIQSFLC
ncbi:MAG: hypothetical protein U1F57_10730 [bacterium]